MAGAVVGVVNNAVARTVDRNYTGGDNAISRLSSLSDGTVTLEGYSYLGLGTVVERSLTQAAVALKYHEGSAGGDSNDIYTGLDRFVRTIHVSGLNGSDAAIEHLAYGMDENGDRPYRANELDSDFDELCHANGSGNRYDQLNQLRATARGPLNGGHDSIASPTWTRLQPHPSCQISQTDQECALAVPPTVAADGSVPNDSIGTAGKGPRGYICVM